MALDNPKKGSQLEREIEKLELFNNDPGRQRKLEFVIASHIRRYTHPAELEEECKDVIQNSYMAVYKYIMKYCNNPDKEIDCMEAFMTRTSIRNALRLVHSLMRAEDVKRDYSISAYYTTPYYSSVWESEIELSQLRNICLRKCEDLSDDHRAVLGEMLKGNVSNLVIGESLEMSSTQVKNLKQTIRRRIDGIFGDKNSKK